MTLKKKSMTINDLEKLLAIQDTNLRVRLNSHQYFNLLLVDQICQVLHCDISDVIEWKEGEQNSAKTNGIRREIVDWDKITNIMKQSDISRVKLSRALEKADNFIQQCIARDSKLNPVDMNKLIEILGCNKSEILK